jgi:hypothetical protein
MSTEKIDAAIKKITEEANKHPNSRKYQIFSELLIDACTTDDVADKLLSGVKSIASADGIISNAARKNDGFIEDDEAHRILFEYFDIAVPGAQQNNALDLSEFLL